MKKVVEDEDRQLRQELIRRSQPPVPPPATANAASSAPDLAGSPSAPPSSHSGPSPALTAPPLPVVAAPSASTGTDPSSAASTAGTLARNIRCKKLETTDTTQKKKRGVVVGAKTREIVRTSGGKIVAEYSELHKGPADPAVRSLMTRDIGSCVKDNVPMIAHTYRDLSVEQKGIVYNYISALYDITPDHDGWWDFIQLTAADRFKDWKSDVHRDWEQFGDDVPIEFLHRPAQWAWLLEQFKDPVYAALCQKMKEIRKGPRRMDHYSGTTAFSYRAERHKNEGHQALFVAAFEDAYAKDDFGAAYVEAMKESVSQRLRDRLEENLDMPPEDPLSIAEQLDVIVSHVGEKRETDIRGVGRCMQREPKKRGGAQHVDVDALVQTQVTQITEQLRAEHEAAAERMRAEYMAQQAATAERMRNMEEQIARILAAQNLGSASTSAPPPPP